MANCVHVTGHTKALGKPRVVKKGFIGKLRKLKCSIVNQEGKVFDEKVSVLAENGLKRR